jgi:hypothetical protein
MYQWSSKIRLLSIALFATLLQPSALLAENAKFDGATGTISIPVLEVPGPFGGVDCYRLQMTLSNPETMGFSLTQADPITCPTLSTSGVTTPILKPPTTTPPTPSTSTTCQNPGSASYNQCQTARLRGTWSFTYQVGTNTLTYVYTLTEVEESTSTPGEYNIWGMNRAGELIMARYHPDDNDFSFLEMTASLNRFFSFTFTSNDTVSGCAYHADSEFTTLGDCYAMTGTRTSRTSREGIRDDVSMAADQSVYEQLMRELANNIR